MSVYFGNLLTAMVTPFTADGEVNYDKAAELAVYLVDNGADGVVVAGTTGEASTLTDEEKIRLFRTVAGALKGRAKVLAGTGTNSTMDTLQLTKAAGECGVDGIMLVVPYYNKPSQEGIYQHFATAAAATDLPVMLYNVPTRTVASMTAETTLRLAQIPNIVAVKEASGNVEQISRICAGAPADFVLYSGDDVATLPILALGGRGVVSVASHVAAKDIKNMITAFHAGETALAARIHYSLLNLFKTIFIATNPVPIKTAMNILGHDVGPVRLPLVELTEEQYEELKKVLGQV
ncbi:MAG: 4-hydroxy-tetrahydrodipicolinate synthase [Clostridiales bacterium]|nr:4-hydroxy-tetrahydrodipicolinate synthase [Clostridiales bacterium]